MNYPFLKILFGTTLIISLLIANTAFACKAHPGDEWFTSKISIDASTLPTGVKFIENPSGYYKEELVNTSATPFYLLQDEWPYTHQSMNTSGKSTELPANEVPLYKIVSNEAYYWNSEKGWAKNLLGTSNDSHIGVNLEAMGIKMMHIRGDNRPKDVIVPAAQEFTFKAYYGSKPVEVSGKVDYALNQNYDSDRHAKGIAACDFSYLTGGGLTGLLTSILIFFAILLSPILTYKFFKKPILNRNTVRIIVTAHIVVMIAILYLLARATGIIY